MNEIKQLHVAKYSAAGDLENQNQVEITAEMASLVNHFKDKFTRLSGDLDLPLEEKIPGGEESMVLRICSEGTAAYVIYYYLDNPIAASLVLAGENEEVEFEIMTTLRFLLLVGDEDEEPDEAAIDAIMAAAEFDFEAIEDRPITYQVVLDDDPSVATQVQSVMDFDLSVAAAFVERSGRGNES